MRFSLADAVQTAVEPAPQGIARRLIQAWYAALFVGGLFLWGNFFNWGLGPINYHDWQAINAPRLAFLQDAVMRGVLPLHISDSLPLAAVTDRFMTIPDVLLSPQIWLLRWMDLGPFILVNTWLLYAAGFAGLMWLRKKVKLSAFAFTVLFFLFNFNGHILSHFTVGHATWTAYFLFPWLLGLAVELFEGLADWGWVTRTALLLLAMLLQGGYHQFIWSLFFLGFLALAAPNRFWILTRAAIFAVLLGSFRLLPNVLNLGEFDNVFIAGYPLFKSIWGALTDIYIPNDITLSGGMTRPVGLWEFSLYTGLLGAIFLVVFGVILSVKHREDRGSYTSLLLPAAGLVLLSFDRVYKYLRLALPIPLITGERISSRIISLAFVIVLVLAVIQLQRWIERSRFSPALNLTWMAAFVWTANDLWQNFRLWRIIDAYDKFELKVFSPARYTVANHPDAQYFTVLWIGLALSLAALGLLFFFSSRERKRKLPR